MEVEVEEVEEEEEEEADVEEGGGAEEGAEGGPGPEPFDATVAGGTEAVDVDLAAALRAQHLALRMGDVLAALAAVKDSNYFEVLVCPRPALAAASSSGGGDGDGGGACHFEVVVRLQARAFAGKGDHGYGVPGDPAVARLLGCLFGDWFDERGATVQPVTGSSATVSEFKKPLEAVRAAHCVPFLCTCHQFIVLRCSCSSQVAAQISKRPMTEAMIRVMECVVDDTIARIAGAIAAGHPSIVVCADVEAALARVASGSLLAHAAREGGKAVNCSKTEFPAAFVLEKLNAKVAPRTCTESASLFVTGVLE
jgi:hypothetical protein